MRAPQFLTLAEVVEIHRDGNKRAALGAALVFLEVNGVSATDPKGELYEAMMTIAAHRTSKEELAALLARLADA